VGLGIVINMHFSTGISGPQFRRSFLCSMMLSCWCRKMLEAPVGLARKTHNYCMIIIHTSSDRSPTVCSVDWSCFVCVL